MINGLFIYYTGTFIYHNMDLKGHDQIKILEKFDVNLLFIFVRISMKQFDYLPEIAFIKNL